MQIEILKKYFLGLLDSEESKNLEIQILEDDSLEDIIFQAENELIEDFLDANLTNEEVIAFNQNFLITKERQSRVEFTGLLRNYAGSQYISEEKPSFFEQLKSLFFQPKFVFGLTAFLFVLLFGISFFIFNSSNNNDSEIAKLNNRDLSNLDNYKDLKVLSLTTENLRSVNNSNLVKLNELSKEILLRLSLPPTNQSSKNFTLNIESNQQNIQTLSNISANHNEVRLLLPKSILQTGEYRLILFNDSAKYNYYFAIQ